MDQGLERKYFRIKLQRKWNMGKLSLLILGTEPVLEVALVKIIHLWIILIIAGWLVNSLTSSRKDQRQPGYSLHSLCPTREANPMATQEHLSDHPNKLRQVVFSLSKQELLEVRSQIMETQWVVLQLIQQVQVLFHKSLVVKGYRIQLRSFKIITWPNQDQTRLIRSRQNWQLK